MARKKAGLYVRKGDRGQTSLADGRLVPKYHCRIEACGSIEELSSIIGMMCSYCRQTKDGRLYKSIQDDLFVVWSIIRGGEGISTDQDRISCMEEMIDEIASGLPFVEHSILPGGSLESSWLDHARAVCRRAERDVCRVHHKDGPVDKNIFIYLNRLSDLLFVLARKHNQTGNKDVLGHKEPLLSCSQ